MAADFLNVNQLIAGFSSHARAIDAVKNASEAELQPVTQHACKRWQLL
jgi:hypothetical protein